MYPFFVLFIVATFSFFVQASAQLPILSIQQQQDDFAIFKGSLKEGHAGLYYYITQKEFEKKCDSIQATFKAGIPVEDYYLKLRFLITTLRHGHTRISLPTQANINYKMAVLDSTKRYLPFSFLIVNEQLVIEEDCSKEQLIPKYSVVKSINHIKATKLIQNMRLYMPADGINLSFKNYSLYNYFYFHHLFNLFYPDKQGIHIELENNPTHFYIELLQPKLIANTYFEKNKKEISTYEQQLNYRANLPNKTAYLQISSFYKGLIENFGQRYEPYLDSVFTHMQAQGTQHLILDLRNNEGGGDGYDNLLLSYLITKASEPIKTTVPGRVFQYTKYATGLSDEFKAFIENPAEFLINDSSLQLKEKYTGQISYPNNAKSFTGKILVLTNGGSFSAATSVIRALYEHRKKANRKIFFIGEENGGDIYSNTICAGQGYSIKLPNSAIVIDMPLLCFGELKTEYPKKRLPDFAVYSNISQLKRNEDAVLKFALQYCAQ